MIEANNKKWVVATPPKTGTYSLLSALVPTHGKRLGQMHQTKYEGPAKIRILIIRHPLERFCSMYWFIKSQSHRKTFWTPFTGKTKNIEEFTRAWILKKQSGSKNLWVRSLAKMVDEFNPTHVVDTRELSKVFTITKIPGASIKQLNETAKKGEKKDWQVTSKGIPRAYRELLLKEMDEDLKIYSSLCLRK